MAYAVNHDAPMGGLASLMAMKGRMGDTELVHMSKPEVDALGAMGKLHVNPQTGLPEAFGLREVIPMAATIAGSIYGGPMGAAAGSFLGNAATGHSLGESAMSGLMSYGLSSLAGWAGDYFGGAASGADAATQAGTAASGATAENVAAAQANAAADTAGAVTTEAAPSWSGSLEDMMDYQGVRDVGIPSGMETAPGSGTDIQPMYNVEQSALSPTPSSGPSEYIAPKPATGIRGALEKDWSTLKSGYNDVSSGNLASTDAVARMQNPLTYAAPVVGELLSQTPDAPEQQAGLKRPVAPSYYGSKVAKGGEYKGGPDAQSALDIALGRKDNKKLITPTTFEDNPQYGLTGMMATGGAIRKMAQDLQKKGNNGDTILAHINKREAGLLKRAGGSGTVNTKTGLLQFYGDEDTGSWSDNYGDLAAPSDPDDPAPDGPAPEAPAPEAPAPEAPAWQDPDASPPSLENLTEPGGPLGSGGSFASSAPSWGSPGTGGKGGPTTGDVPDLNNAPNKDNVSTPEESGTKSSGPSEYDPGFLGHMGDFMRNITYDLRNNPLSTMVNLGVALTPGLQAVSLANTAMGLAGKSTIGNAVTGQFSPAAKAERDADKTNNAEWAAHNAQMAGTPSVAAPGAAPAGGPPGMGQGGDSGVLQPYYPPRVAQGGGLVSLATGGQPQAQQQRKYFEGQVKGNGDGMSDEVPFDIHNSTPNKALLSKDEYVLPADVVSMIGNGSSNAGSEEIDRFVAHIRKQAHGVSKQQKQLKGDKGLLSLVS